MKNINKINAKYGSPLCPLVAIPFIIFGVSFFVHIPFDTDASTNYIINKALFYGTAVLLLVILAFTVSYLNSKLTQEIQDHLKKFNNLIYPMGLKVGWKSPTANNVITNPALQVKLLPAMRYMYCIQRGIPFEMYGIVTSIYIPPELDLPPAYSTLEPPKYDSIVKD